MVDIPDIRKTQTADTGSSVAELRTVITDRNYGPYGRKTALTDAIRITDRNYGITDRNYGNRNYGLSVIQTQGLTIQSRFPKCRRVAKGFGSSLTPTG